jgi:hypothetical protein
MPDLKTRNNALHQVADGASFPVESTSRLLRERGFSLMASCQDLANLQKSRRVNSAIIQHQPLNR